MSATLQDNGLFASRKRRSGEFVDALKQETKRPFAEGKTRDVDGGSSSVPSPYCQGAAVDDVAPKAASVNSYVQAAIHKEVQYSREGESKVPENVLKVFRFVKQHFVIPKSFEKDHEFGPLSGVSHELRVVFAYMAGQLEARCEADAGVKMCLECGRKGHFPRHCPSAFLQ